MWIKIMFAGIVRMKLQDKYISICCPIIGKLLFEGTRAQARRLKVKLGIKELIG